MKKSVKLILIITVLLITGSLFSEISVEILPFCTTGIERMPWFHEGTLYYVGTNYDIYTVTYEGSKWGKPEWLPGDVNTAKYEISPYVIRNNGKLVMYFARYNKDTNYDFYRAEFDATTGVWTNVQLIPELSTSTQDWDIWVSSDESIAYVATKGSFGSETSSGGRDIWMSKKIDGKWTTPVNVRKLNSTSNEWSIFIDPDGLFWFDSAREGSIGGYDIFFYDPSTLETKHPGKAINSPSDERSLWTDGAMTFFTGKDRKDGAGSYDIFMVTSEITIRKKKDKISQDGEALVLPIYDLKTRKDGVYVYQDMRVTVKGTVLVDSGKWHNNENYFAVHDGTAGILVYAPGKTTQVRKGDRVRVTGTLSTYGYTTDVGSLFVLPESSEEIVVIESGVTPPAPEIIFTDSSKTALLRYEASPVMIFGKLSGYDNETITRGFFVTGTSKRDFEDLTHSMRVKFYEYADIDISDLAEGDFVAVQGVLVQDKEGNFYLRPTEDSDIRKYTRNRILFLSTIARKDLVGVEEEKEIAQEAKVTLPPGMVALTTLKSTDRSRFSSRLIGTADQGLLYCSVHKEKGTRTGDYPPSIYGVEENSLSQKVLFPGEADFPSIRGKSLVFAGRLSPDEIGSSWDLYGYNMEINQVTALTSTKTDEIEPAIAPTRELVAFSKRNEGKWQLALLHLKTGEVRTLTENGRKATWSPTSNELAFQKRDGDNWDIFTLELERKQEKGLIETPWNEFWPAWSPKGSKLAFMADYRGITEIFIMDLFNMTVEPLFKEKPTRTLYPFWLSEEEIGFCLETATGPNLVKFTFEKDEQTQAEVPETSPVNFLLNPRFGSPQIVENRVLRIEVPSGYKIDHASLVSGFRHFSLSHLCEELYFVPSSVKPGLYGIRVVAEFETKKLVVTEPNSVYVGKTSSKFTFVHLTDLHLDLPQRPKNVKKLRQLMELVRAEEPDFVIITGDLSTSTQNYPTNWKMLKNTIVELLKVPVFIVPGNHDTQRAGNINGHGLWKEIFGKNYYSFDWGNWHFIGLDTADSDYGLVSGTISHEQFYWLEGELKSVNKNLAIFGHHNPFDTRWIFYEDLDERDKLEKLLINHEVKLALFGHRHTDAIDYDINCIAVTTRRAIEKDGTFSYRIVGIQEDHITELVVMEPKSCK